ncbi:hypothetical protein E2562_016409 [Oryza meyeriana var. granulata]|uniref:Uncharacterized protein n=1 Tax=Oryza meyeriana var. granulata TaxID=110450 RepID=A0A6G1EWZ5_9ORYZ|nr:hypothetical protein E2562_016409 [Oryza meyeriana var. granulata]
MASGSYIITQQLYCVKLLHSNYLPVLELCSIDLAISSCSNDLHGLVLACQELICGPVLPRVDFQWRRAFC